MVPDDDDRPLAGKMIQSFKRCPCKEGDDCATNATQHRTCKWSLGIMILVGHALYPGKRWILQTYSLHYFFSILTDSHNPLRRRKVAYLHRPAFMALSVKGSGDATIRSMENDFYSLYTHDFIRVAVSVPSLRVADPDFNAGSIIDLAREADHAGAVLVLFPELSVSAYSNEDLFHQDALLEGSQRALDRITAATKELNTLVVVGCPLRYEGGLYNCAVLIYDGRLMGIVPKSYLPNYREFYEKRQFTSGAGLWNKTLDWHGSAVPFGSDLLFTAKGIPHFRLFLEICEDLWSPIPPSSFAALAGATLIANPSASNITVGKAAYRKLLCASQSAKCLSAYVYSAAGYGESSTDLAWDGNALIYENQALLAETARFSSEEQLVLADIDLGRLMQDRMRQTSFQDARRLHQDRIAQFREVSLPLSPPEQPVPLKREILRFPYVPSQPAQRDERCFDVYNIQVSALAKRMEATGIKRLVIGVSGGLDSTQALLVSAHTMDRLELPRENILAYTMPGFATSERTRGNALALMEALGVSSHEIDIRPSCMQMLKDLDHPFARGEHVFDVTFENVQAGERTSHLFRLANMHGALVVGTGDLSELALGWTTYGVGDQMAHYNVNASVPKTLIQYLIRWVIDQNVFGKDANTTLNSILETAISPELIPAHDSGDRQEEPAQRTEDVIGPYALHDFFLYYTSRFGFRPSKVAYLCWQAWENAQRGSWPDLLPVDARTSYSLDEIKRWLHVFLVRFIKTSQFKRSTLPNGPKVGSGGSLSPRSDWRAPSDAEVAAWLEELNTSIP